MLHGAFIGKNRCTRSRSDGAEQLLCIEGCNGRVTESNLKPHRFETRDKR